MKVKNKKGILYMTVSIMFLFIMLIVYSLTQRNLYSESQDTIDSRVQTMNAFVNDLHNDLPRAMYVSAFRGFIAMEEYVLQEGHYLSDTEGVFVEVFTNGTINGTFRDIMQDSTLYDYLARVNMNANSLGMDLDLHVTNVTLVHEEPFLVVVELDLTVALEDLLGVASWNYTRRVRGKVPIDDLRDPLYSVETLSKLPSPINRWNETSFVNATLQDTSKLERFLNGTYYIPNPNAPNFIQRFSDNNTASPYGITSLVDLQRLSVDGGEIFTNRSVADYVYFGNQTPVLVCNVTGMPNWFKIDVNNEALFEVDQINGTNLC